MGTAASSEMRPDGLWGWLCQSCVDCDELTERRTLAGKSPGTRSIDRKLRELFNLQDLKGDGFLEEQELVKLNEKIAMLHFGKKADKQAVKTKYQKLFRTKLDNHGQPVPYSVFHEYMQQFLDSIDSSLGAQEMILEQFIAEAQSGRMAFYTCASFHSSSDEPFLPKLSSTEIGLLQCAGLQCCSPTSRSASIESLLSRRHPHIQ